MQRSGFSFSRSLIYLTSAACMLGFVGCPVDTRRLEFASAGGGQGGSHVVVPTGGGLEGGRAGTSPGAAGSGGGPDQSEGGAAGATGQFPITVDGCPDLDENGVADCTETKVSNAEFSTDVSEWTADAQNGDPFSTTLAWDPQNAGGSVPSGSAKVSVSGTLDFNGASLRAASQCVAISAAQILIVYANARLEAGQDPAAGAEIDVSFFDAADCSGLATSSFSTPPSEPAPAATWLTLHAGSLASESTKSALIKLGVVKPFRAESITARFDNILVRVQAP